MKKEAFENMVIASAQRHNLAATIFAQVAASWINYVGSGGAADWTAKAEAARAAALAFYPETDPDLDPDPGAQ